MIYLAKHIIMECRQYVHNTEDCISIIQEEFDVRIFIKINIL